MSFLLRRRKSKFSDDHTAQSSKSDSPVWRSYFSRITRERRRIANESQASVGKTDAASSQIEHEQQDEEDQTDYDAAISTSEAYELLDIAIDTLDDMFSWSQP